MTGKLRMLNVRPCYTHARQTG